MSSAAAAAPRDGAPGAGSGAANDNTNGGSSTSQSSGGTFTRYNLLRLLLFRFLISLLVAILWRSMYDDDAYSILSMLLVIFDFITRSPHIVHAMIIVLIFWNKICRYMTIFPTNFSSVWIVRKDERSTLGMGSNRNTELALLAVQFTKTARIAIAPQRQAQRSGG